MTGTDPPSDSVPDPNVLPCGCVLTYAIVNGTRTMTVSPCRQSCPTLADVLGLADAVGRPVEYRRGK